MKLKKLGKFYFGLDSAVILVISKNFQSILFLNVDVCFFDTLTIISDELCYFQENLIRFFEMKTSEEDPTFVNVKLRNIKS
jgi:hypothetical protein